MKHYSVLLEETINGLNIKETGIYVDATLGYAGHSKEILKRNKKGFLFAFDQDSDAILESEKTLSKVGKNYKLFNKNFVSLKSELMSENVTLVDGIIFDLGLSSPQIDNPAKGFTFMQDAPLDMRMDKTNKLSAKDVVNNYKEEELIHIFYKYGEVNLAKQIAKKIVEERSKKEITTTKELVSIIERSVGAKIFNTKHPERQIFQAIRIEVNSELSVLESVLPDAISLLKSGGRICVITFHSLEDRIVKQIFKKFSEVEGIVKGLPEIPDEYKPKIKIINKKPILPSEDEIRVNSRSKSAKLRIIERI